MEGYRTIFTVFLITFFSQFLFSQQFSTDELFEFYENADTKEKKIKFAKAFLKQSKRENNNKRIITGYYLLAYENKNELKLSYLDSIIFLTKDKPLGHHPAIAYNEKAKYLQKKGLFERAIDNYVLSNKFASFSSDKYLSFYNNSNIGTIKRFIGEYEESLILFRKCLNFIKNEISKPEHHINYLKTIVSLSSGHYESRNLDSASYYNRFGVSEALKLENLETYHRLSLTQGIIHYYQGDEKVALDSILKHKEYFYKNKDSVNLSYAHFYLGKINGDSGMIESSVSHYKKVDSLLSFKRDLTSKFRNSYVFLINHYKKEQDLKNQLFYINRLMFFDSIMNSKTNYLSKTIFKEYDIPVLKLEKEKIRKDLHQKSASFKRQIYLVSFFLILAVIFLIYQYKRRQIYKQRFLDIINDDTVPEKQKKETVKIETEKLEIPQDVIEHILNKLEVFEKQKKYLSKDITLSSLAKELDTNTAYLSKIINHFKKEKFSTYLNNLKIEYIIQEIKTNPVLRKFTIKAISEEAYFNNPDSFSKAFYKLKGIKPSYFFKEINDLEKNN